MDIEGSEYQVLEYMKEKNMINKIKCLLCELHVNEKQDRYFYKFLKSYKINPLKGETLEQARIRIKNKISITNQQNYFFTINI